MDLAEAKGRFDRAMGYCDDIVAVHKKSGGAKKGLRTLEPALNRAVVVMAAAAWQTVIQDFTTSALDHANPPGSGGVGMLLRGQVVQAVAGFSTPDSAKSRALLRLVDFDPYPHWTWKQMGGQGVGSVTITPSHAARMIDDWLRLRHDIAHGHPRLSVVDVLESVRGEVKTWRAAHPAATHQNALDHLKNNPAFEPSLRLSDATRCVAYFRRLATLTAKALVNEGVGPDVW